MIKRLQHYWAITVFTVFFLPLTVSLGFWQLDRADQKRQLQVSLAALEQPITLPQGQALELTGLKNFQRVTLNSRFIKPFIWLKDNQVVKGKVGYDAVGLIQLGSQLLLVNRGWFASYGQRNPLPMVEWVDGEVSLTGRLVLAQANPYQLAADVYTNQYPQLVQAIDPLELAVHIKTSVDGTLLPWVLMLDAPGDATLTPHWRASSITDEKHLAYAWQWFGLALTLIMLYIYRVFYSPMDTKKVNQ
jgi:surfeit locus 1 family protein|tara:strand:+ start:1134 stop:1871 length:738 start_codon:yes stop_codon:yes gene_type:complete